MKRLYLLALLWCAAIPALASQGPFYAVQDDVDVIIGPIMVYTADGTTLSSVDFNSTGLDIHCTSPQSSTVWRWEQANTEIDDETSHTVHGDPAAGQIGFLNSAGSSGHVYLHFVDDLWSVTDWRFYGCHMTDAQTLMMDTDFMIWRVEAADDLAVDVRTEMDANSTKLDVAVSSRAVPGDEMNLANDAITAGKIALDSIGPGEIASNAIGADELAADAVIEIHDGLNCEVNTLNFAGDASNFACILTDLDGAAVTKDTGDLTGRQIIVTSGDQVDEERFINNTTWDATNSELQIGLSRALPAALADAVTVVIR